MMVARRSALIRTCPVGGNPSALILPSVKHFLFQTLSGDIIRHRHILLYLLMSHNSLSVWQYWRVVTHCSPACLFTVRPEDMVEPPKSIQRLRRKVGKQTTRDTVIITERYCALYTKATARWRRVARRKGDPDWLSFIEIQCPSASRQSGGSSDSGS